MNKYLLLLTILVISACGSDSPEDKPLNNYKVGILIDSPVINIDYSTASQSTLQTNNKGEFTYLEGESVTFSIGDLVFPAVVAKSVITPLDMANSINEINDEAVNILRLLQTLDSDGDPANGIEITDTAKALATQFSFDLTQNEFANLPQLIELISNAGQDFSVNELISSTAAQIHFQQQLVLNNVVTTKEPFTAAQLDNMTFYVVLRDSECPDTQRWYVETFTFTQGRYSLRLCTGELEQSTYSIVNNDTISLDAFGEYIAQYTRFSNTNTFLACFSQSLSDVENCMQEDLFTGFLEPNDATLYAAQLNRENTNNNSAQFTESELGSYTFYMAVQDESCPIPERWYLESITLANSSYNMQTCNNSAEQGTYTLLESGIVKLNEPNEFIKRFSINAEQNTFIACYTDFLFNGENCTQNDAFIGHLVAADAQALVAQLNQNASFSIDMRLASASSTIESSYCPGVLGGWAYSFTNTHMTLNGSDGWNNCVLIAPQSISIDMRNLGLDYDIPFNCLNYPICVESDFNKTITGVDEDNRNFTSTYTFNRSTKQIRYVKSVLNVTYTELISIND